MAHLPSAAELAAAADLPAALAWAGVSAPMVAALWAAVGEPSGGIAGIREVALIPPEAWEAALAALRVPSEGVGGAGEPGAAPTTRSATAIELARISALRAFVRAKMGMSTGPDNGGAGSPTTASPPAIGQRKLKMAAIVDQTLDAEVVPMSSADVRVLFAAYKAKRGDMPHADIEPTGDQVAAVQQLLAADAPPYADFAVFGPHGRRLAAKLSFSAFTYTPDGSWQRRELPGPPGIEPWWLAWRVLKTALLLLDAADVEHLDNYGEYIRALHSRYGNTAWFIIYTADVRMRSEHFEHLRRNAEAEHAELLSQGRASPHDPARPWNYVFKLAVTDKIWWDENCRDPAVLFLSRAAPASSVIQDGTAQPYMSYPGGAEASFHNAAPARRRDADGPAAPSKRARKRTAKAAAAAAGASADADREICFNYNAGRCYQSCPANRLHKCTICGGSHPATSCHRGKDAGEGKGAKGGGKGKGKSQEAK